MEIKRDIYLNLYRPKAPRPVPPLLRKIAKWKVGAQC